MTMQLIVTIILFLPSLLASLFIFAKTPKAPSQGLSLTSSKTLKTPIGSPNLSQISPEKLLKKIDELYRSRGSRGQMEMQVITPDWTCTLKMDMWTKGQNYIFITIKEPKKDKSVSSLKRKNEKIRILYCKDIKTFGKRMVPENTFTLTHLEKRR